MYDEVIHDTSKVLDKEQYNIDCLYYRGLSYSKLDQQSLAIRDLSIVLEINPDHVNASFARAACFNTIGQFSRGIFS